MAISNKIRPVIISGGSGTRMWPVSRRTHPKQFHNLASDASLFEATLARVARRDIFSAPIILASARHEAHIRKGLDVASVSDAQMILEPFPKNTAPAIAALAVECEQRNPGDIVVVLPADHAVADADAFADALQQGLPSARDGHIVTFGVKPTRAETGYGYIHAGAKIDEHSSIVQSFKEKPAAEVAQAYLDAGNYFWNGGIFMFRTDVMIDELRKFCPHTLGNASKAVERGERTADAIILNSDDFDKVEEESIDYAIMEKTSLAAVVPIDVGWSDVGSWLAVWEISNKDERNNAGAGNVDIMDSDGVLAVSNGPHVAALGVSDLIIIATPDGILVTPRERAQDVKKIVDRLKETNRSTLL